MDTISILKDKRIVLAVSGSIAAYKAVDLASKLTQAGAQVDVIMTDAAKQFVTPLAFQAVTGRTVYDDMWNTDSSGGLPTHIAHVGLAEGADLLAVIPATANTLAKLATGLADNLLTVTALAARCPLLLAPAMDGGMYEHPAVQHNLQTLVNRGAMLLEPEIGRFASGLTGKGRLPETATLIGAIRQTFARSGPLAGRRVIVTAGGTREPIDPVRYITNRSSGKQGYAVAQAALDAGAEVTLISTVDLASPFGAEVVKVESASDMLKAVLNHIPQSDGLVMAAAVADFRPAAVSSQKIKKTSDETGMSLELARTLDILLEVKTEREKTGFPRAVVGFAAESENLLANAEDKRIRKGLDLLIANDITASDAGFAVDTNRVVVFDALGHSEILPLMSKTAVAEFIIRKIAELL